MKININFSDFTINDWTELGAEFKRNKLLPPSYAAYPSRVELEVLPSGEQIAKISFKSKLTQDFKTIKLRPIYTDLSISSNGSVCYKSAPAMEKIWTSFALRFIERNEMEQQS